MYELYFVRFIDGGITVVLGMIVPILVSIGRRIIDKIRIRVTRGVEPEPNT